MWPKPAGASCTTTGTSLLEHISGRAASTWPWRVTVTNRRVVLQWISCWARLNRRSTPSIRPGARGFPRQPGPRRERWLAWWRVPAVQNGRSLGERLGILLPSSQHVVTPVVVRLCRVGFLEAYAEEGDVVAGVR